MPLKLSKKKAPKAPQTSTGVPIGAKDPSSFPEREIIKEPDQPRRVRAATTIWSEVFATKSDEQLTIAKNLLHKNHMSLYTLLDKETGERMVMTTETFMAEARRVLYDEGLTIWGLDE